MKSKYVAENPNMKKIAIFFAISYCLFAILLYFLMGEQLHYRDSRGNILPEVANAATIELVQGTRVEQIFQTKIQIIEQLDIQWGTFGRKNKCTNIVELIDKESNQLIASQTVQGEDITEGYITKLKLPQLEGYYDKELLIRITSTDAQPGNAVTPVMNTNDYLEDGQLYFNGEPVDGVLTFTLTGRDYIWTGLHYWEFVLIGFIIVLFVAIWSVYCQKKGRKNIIVNAFAAINRYEFLIRQLVNRDFRIKYKRSILGVFWSFLNPLLTMLVQYAVFSNIFKFDIKYFPVYLLCGIIIFNYFTEASGMALTSIIGNATLITKVYVPKYIYPLTRILSSLINLVISLIPLLVVVILTGLPLTKAVLLLPFVLVCLAIFCLGMGMLLSSAMVFFRDTQFLWGVFSMIWMYLTPTFYPPSILPDNVVWLLDINPMYYYITFMRSCLIDGISPEPIMYVQCALFSIVMLAIGAAVFKKSQDKFILYL